ncbi:hypothetical protein [Paracoccus seriniphilus]|uniref:Uncharacterized protein n=1 Tax=Paracoccus seriniphilus TaxID=184748 RepID=A0A239Q0W8_9RHOB|nr:hypothetical protein [Paracoccus seriniphilus]WCR15748.1 hypothetical protein JHW44_14670 [Paracoccus seriniphilus]SNT76211.1 hypothetical protein SAMN05444959_11676 [Paracoccus seriniphilus]
MRSTPARTTSAVQAPSTSDSAMVAAVKRGKDDPGEGQRIIDQDQNHQHRDRPHDVDVMDRQQPQWLDRVKPDKTGAQQ